MTNKPDADLLRSLFSYDADTGILRWLIDPSCGSRNIGDEAGYVSRMSDCTSGKPYYCVTVKSDRYMAHQAIWCIVTGVWPELEIDHIDGNGLNNRWLNLREATHAQNMSNRKMQRNNTSGYRGVHCGASNRKWMAKIKINSKMVHLGGFDSADEAAHAYNKAAIEHHGEFARLNVAGLPAFKHANGE